jgi:hypothetical protein
MKQQFGTRARAALAATFAIAAVTAAGGVSSGAAGRATASLSPTASNGASDHVSFSQDGRTVRWVAYDSTAANLVPGDTNQRRDVFVLTRANPGTSANFNGNTSIVSVGNNGSPANGDSQNASMGASPCVVFESTATNLDRHDNNPDSDIYIRDLRRRTTKLVSIGLANATDPSIDSKCSVVAFTANGSVYIRDLLKQKTSRIGTGASPDIQNNGKGVAYVRGGHVYDQQIVRKFRKKNNFVKNGRETLVDRNSAGQKGNGTSANPVTDDNGYYVAFESTSTNLCQPSTCAGIGAGVGRFSGSSQIFRRTINPKKAPSHDYMQVASYSQGCSASDPHAKHVDALGDGPSNNPSMTGAGENIVFDSQANNLYEPGRSAATADPNGRGVRDIYYWNFPRGRKCGNISRESRDDSSPSNGGPLNGDSYNPAASNRANFIGFTSDQTGAFGESNGRQLGDVYIRFLGGE